MSRFFLILFFSLFSVGTLAAQEVIDFQSVRDLAGIRSQQVFLSPDGTMLAYATLGEDDERLLCLFYFADETQDCAPVPDAFNGRLTNLRWSPDSTQLAFHEDILIQRWEPDIWIFSTALWQFTNITDDGYAGSVLADDAAEFTADTTPVWNPADGMLYFFRDVTLTDGTGTQTLMRLNADMGLEEIVQFPSIGRLAVYHDTTNYFFEGAAAFSPDGEQLALRILTPDINRGGVYLWSADGGLTKITEFVLRDGLPTWSDANYRVKGLSWSPDGTQIFIGGQDSRALSPLASNVVIYDIAAATLTPLLDYTTLAGAEAFLAQQLDSPLGYVLSGAAVLPDGNLLLHGRNKLDFGLIAVTDDAQSLTVLTAESVIAIPGGAQITVSDEMVLFGRLLVSYQ